jgi:hypothetical protein
MMRLNGEEEVSMYSEVYWECCGTKYPYTQYRCPKCGKYTWQVKAEKLVLEFGGA